MDGLKANQFQGVDMNDVSIVEILLTLNILLLEIDFVNWIIVGELVGRVLQKFENFVRLVKESNHIIYAM